MWSRSRKFENRLTFLAYPKHSTIMSLRRFTGSDVSVVIPAYNAGKTIERCIDTVLSQTTKPLEIIVVDDGSIDDTTAKLAAYGLAIQIICQRNEGAASARNRGVAVAKGDLIAFLDADDCWHTKKIARQIEIFNNYPSVAICRTRSTGLRVGDPYDSTYPVARKPVELVTDFRKVFLNPYFGTPTVMLKKQVFDECGGFNTLFQTGEDVDLWLRASYGRCVARLDEKLVGITSSPTSLTASTNGRANHDNLRVIEAFLVKHPDFRKRHPIVVRKARAMVMVRIGSQTLTSNVKEARRVFWVSFLHYPFSLDPVYLLFKSLFKRKRADAS